MGQTQSVLTFMMVMFITLFIITPARSEIYLKKTESGKIKLTDDPIDESYKLILDSKIPEEYDIPSKKELREYVATASEEYGIPETLIYAVIRIESGGDETARSHEGALGLMQLMPSTAESLGVENPYEPRENIMGGSRYLKRMLNTFDGDLSHALAAYNAGPGSVHEHNGIPPFQETEEFVKRVRSAFKQFRRDSDLIYTYYDDRGVLHVTNIH